MFAALGSMACSTTVRQREVVYVPVGVRTACACEVPMRSHRAASAESYRNRDAVQRTRHVPRASPPAEEERHGVKWGRARGKAKGHEKRELEVARSERPESPPGLAKRRPQEEPPEAKDKNKDEARPKPAKKRKVP
jgi:hypothetical protein